jgi:hypothetical protein
MSQEAAESSFDHLTRGLASDTLSRGKALRLMGAALVGGVLGSLGGFGEAAAAPSGCKRSGKACKTDNQCCSGSCANGTCAACPAGKVLLSNGTCANPCTGAQACAAACFSCYASGTAPPGSTGYCGDHRTGSGIRCNSDSDCNLGEFCNNFGMFLGFCISAC